MAELKEAIDAVSVVDIARHLGIELKVGMNKSPFRKVKSGEPFSVFAGGHAFKDHGCEEHRGSCWEFLALARPDLPKGERAKIIFALSGLDPDEGYSKAAWRSMKKAQRKLAYKARSAAFLETKSFPAPEPWTEVVRDRWDDGAGLVPVDRLARSRGWPVEWVAALVDAGKVSFPWLPWADPKFGKARHGLAFRVEAPERSSAPGGWSGGVVPVGYHQQWIHEDRESGARRKDWLFVPYAPKKCSSGFQEALAADGRRISPFPFVLGELAVAPRNVVIAEGQWDAATLYGAAGWFGADGAAGNTVVFGLRGAQSVEVFLAFYGRWIRAVAPNILLLPDNDEAGRRWIEREDDNKIVPHPCFLERLRAWGAKRVAWRQVNKKFGKDFNDYWRARAPSVADVRDWLAGCGLEL